MMSANILLVGTGITGALTASILQKQLPMAKILLWDKARGAGGRMSVCRNPVDESCQADLGAQYITTTKDSINKHDAIYKDLLENNVLEKLNTVVEGMKTSKTPVHHFVAPNGMNSVVKHFLKAIPKDNISFNHKVTTINMDNNDKFIVTTNDNDSCTVDAVILTLPVPQILDLGGSIQNFISEKKGLRNIAYSNRFVLVLFYKNGVFPEESWSCKYLDHNVIRYASIDNRKRNRRNEPTAVVLHTNVDFGKLNLEEPVLEVQKKLLEHVKEIFPNWPEPSSVRCHKWRYSQVTEPYAGKPGFLLLNEKPTLLLGGDAFAESNFDGCIYSATKLVDTLRKIWEKD